MRVVNTFLGYEYDFQYTMSADTGLFPFRSSVENSENDPRLVSIGDADVDDMFAALSSDTSRRVLTTLYDEPLPASDIADRIDSSLQNIQYHLDRLRDLDLIRVVDTWYSSRGVEMKVYAPTNDPIVVVAGDAESERVCRDAVDSVVDSDVPTGPADD